MNGIPESQMSDVAQNVNRTISTEKKRIKRNDNIVGLKFGDLTVMETADRGKYKELRLLCLCDCGNKKNVSRSHLIGGDVKSCGCFLKEFKKTHGMSYTRTYTTWESMIDRCFNENYSRFNDYGARGISVCKAWIKFEKFYEDMGDRPKGKTLDRIDNTKGYFKENCRWATPKEQSRNSRSNIIIEYNNMAKCIEEWAEYLKINSSTLRKRLNRGWSVERAFLTEVE